MFLRNISLFNFKSYTDFSVDFSRKVTCFTGKNGVGKTNLLDAVYFACLSKSHFLSQDSQLLRHGAEKLSVRACFSLPSGVHHIQGIWSPSGGKEFRLDEAPVKKMAEFIGQFPVVFVSPNDQFLIYEGSEERRRLMDNLLCQTDRVYLDNLLLYNRIVQQRNALLKQFVQKNKWDSDLLDALDHRLPEPASYIFQSRKTMLTDIQTDFQTYYSSISGGAEMPDLTYQSELEKVSMDALLTLNRDKDSVLQRTSAGIHKDEVDFGMNGHKVKRFASQGQQKSYLLALKLATYQFLKRKAGFSPILLLDDLFDRLDTTRCANLMQVISDDQIGQVLLSDTSIDSLRQVSAPFSDKFDYFEIGNQIE